MKILVLNCGSSSIKYQLIDMSKDANLLAIGLVERIGLEKGILTHKPTGKDKYKIEIPIENHKKGISLVLEALVDKNHGVIDSVAEINAAGHRVAHGGEIFPESVLVTPKAKIEIGKLSELAPLHNPANLEGILSLEEVMPNIPQVAVFDTSFHQTMPAYAYLYAIPYEYYQNNNVRRYGFHGTSHKYVAPKACQQLGMDYNKAKIITCHLGNGASIAAIKNGKSIDTSMGFTPVEGLVMGTRAGDTDLGVLFYLMEKENLDAKGLSDVFNKKSGLLGISGISSDMRDLETAADQGNERAQVALDMFSYRVKKYIGAYSAAMGGVDIIIFTGGIGENACAVRENVCKDMEYLGLEFDFEKNKELRGQDAVISKENSKTKVMIVTTNEELVIAQDTLAIVNNCK